MEKIEKFSKREIAKIKVEKLKRFYSHLGVYLTINTIITLFKVSNNFGNWDVLQADLLSFSTLSSWIVWGFILGIHAFSVFVFPKLLGYEWEARKIEQLMEEDLKSKE